MGYDPLHDDAQAMALVKKFELDIEAPRAGINAEWEVYRYDNLAPNNCHSNADLNRAICETVAKMKG